MDIPALNVRGNMYDFHQTSKNSLDDALYPTIASPTTVNNPEPNFKIPAPMITKTGFVGATNPAIAMMIRPIIGNAHAIANIFSLPSLFTICMQRLYANNKPTLLTER